jgi:4,5-dihydroxyphthalate decarboxylase
MRALVRLFQEAKAAAPVTASDGRDPLVFGRAALDPALRLALRYTLEQGLLPRHMKVEELWEGLHAEVA